MRERKDLGLTFVSGTEIYAGLLVDAGFAFDVGHLLSVVQNTLVLPAPAEHAAALDSKPFIATCQWIDGDPHWSDTCKCGAPATEGTAWCKTHLSRVFEPLKSVNKTVSPLPEGSMAITASQALGGI